MTRPPVRTPGDITAVLREERVAVQSFVALLVREQDALLQGDVDRVGASAAAKTRELLHLAELAQRRGRFLQSESLTPDRKGMDAWIARYAAPVETVAEWQELLRAIRTAHDVNQTNGMLIEAGMRANNQALAAIRSAANMGGVYGPDGHARAFIPKRQIETA